MFDPQLARGALALRAEAAAVANACVPDALLVRAGAGDAELMTGEDDPERAALALLKAGARMVVITLGPRARSSGASYGSTSRAWRRRSCSARSGAGEVLTGLLLARLATSALLPVGGRRVAARGGGGGDPGVRAMGRA